MPSETIPQMSLTALFATHKQEFLEAIERVVSRSAFVGGDELSAFELKFANWHGEKMRVAGCGNGTDAILLAAKALNLPAGSEAIVPAMTYFATVEGLVHAGIKVKLIDIDPKSWTLDASKVEAAMTDKTRLIVPVHLYGRMAEMDRLREIADRYQCAILEDASQAHGAKWKSKPVGFWGDVATYSFYPGKNLGAFGDAGAVASRRGDLIDIILKLRNHGGIIKYHHEVMGFNSRLDNLQAAILNVKMKYIDSWNEARRRVAARYFDAFQDLNQMTLPDRDDRSTHVFHQYVVLVDKREKFMDFLKERGIETGVHYPKALHQLQALSEFKSQSFPCAENLASRCVSMPMCPTLNDDAVARICQVVRDYFGK